MDVFPDEILRLLPKREVKFAINLVLGVRLVPIAL